jgi:5-methylcytosine-specific restriction protein A
MSPWSPLKACAAPGCPNRVVKGRCPQHSKQAARLEDERRGSRHERGYDNRWAKYSKARLQQHPLCADPFHVHDELGAFAECTDHVVPAWAGGDFWDPENHQSLCKACNTKKLTSDRAKYGRKP